MYYIIQKTGSDKDSAPAVDPAEEDNVEEPTNPAAGPANDSEKIEPEVNENVEAEIPAGKNICLCLCVVSVFLHH